jgi:ABC-type transport system involved in multi-copper enzyme maturation permease subunit
MRGLLYADWIRFRHRYDLWIILVAVLLLAVLGFVSGATSANSQPELPPFDPSMPPEMQALIEAQNAQIEAQMALMRDLYVFPRSIVTVLEQGSWLFLAAAFVAASWIASEFDWGTIRNVVLARPERGRFLAARLLALMAVMSVALVALGALGAVLPVLVRVVGSGQPSGVTPLAILLTGIGGSIWSLAFIAVAALAAVVTRSPIFALILAYGYFLLDGLLGNLVIWKSAGLEWLPQFLLGVRLSGLLADIRVATGLRDASGGAPTTSAVHLDPIAGLLVIAAWISLSLGLTYAVLRRADIRE